MTSAAVLSQGIRIYQASDRAALLDPIHSPPLPSASLKLLGRNALTITSEDHDVSLHLHRHLWGIRTNVPWMSVTVLNVRPSIYFDYELHGRGTLSQPMGIATLYNAVDLWRPTGCLWSSLTSIIYLSQK